MGGLLAVVVVVFVFMRRTRPTMIVAAAIPLSLIATFGIDLGLRLHAQHDDAARLERSAIGVVIDDAIIVLENIERHREGGKSATPGRARRHPRNYLRRSRSHVFGGCRLFTGRICQRADG